MLKKIHLTAVGCCLSLSAMASTIEYTPDDHAMSSKSWYTSKDWLPVTPQYPAQQYASKTTASSVKKTHWWTRSPAPAKPVQMITPLRIVPQKKVTKPVFTPFPARIAPSLENKYPWIFSGSVGYTQYEQAGDSSGGALVGRFAIGKALYHAGHTMAGLELGVQNGNRMSIGASQETLDLMGSLPIWTTVKPMVDLLGVVQVGFDKTPAFLIAKGGIAYRTWETERQSINNLSQVAGEVQLGIGIPIVKQATLSLVYQGVFGGSTDFTVNPDSSATVSNIPIQNGVLLSLSLLL